MDIERFNRLLERHFDQVLSKEERAELERTLLASPKARDAFWEAAQWHAIVRHWGESKWGAEPQTSQPARMVRASIGKSGWQNWRAAAWVAGLTLVLTLAGWEGWRRLSTRVGPETRTPASDREERTLGGSVAILTRSIDTQWEVPGLTPYRGEAMTAGRLRLKSGVAQIEFARGARLVIEGPADLDLATDNEIVLRDGTVRAFVPETARGFTARTPGFTLVDRGTEFGCWLQKTGEAEIHVLQGELDLRIQDSTPKTLVVRGNEAIRLVGSHNVSTLVAQRRRFVSDEELTRREQNIAAAQLDAWRKTNREMHAYPQLSVHLDFEDTDHQARVLGNRAINALSGSGASLVGCDWVEGRWAGKRAVEFKQCGDRLWLKVSGTLNAITFLAWVRVDSLPNYLHSLFMANGPGGQINWCIKNNGALSFGIQMPEDGRGWLINRSTTKIRPEQLGSWLCLATIYATDGTVTHYINGEQAGSGKLFEFKPGELGTCAIGNCTISKSEVAYSTTPPELPRNFQGRMDEFAIFSTALKSEEIRRLHAQGRDPRPSPSP